MVKINFPPIMTSLGESKFDQMKDHVEVTVKL